MKCNAYAIADSLNIDDLTKYLRVEGFEPKLFDDVIHITTSHAEDKSSKADIFIFNYGCLVAWNVNLSKLKELFKNFKDYSTNHYGENYYIEPTKFQINPEEKTHILEEEDLIIIENEDESIKLSFSHALSQSVKLDVFEFKVNTTIQATRPISDELALTGKVSLSRQKLSKLIGQLFAERNSINLDNDILDLPEFFWRRPKYAQVYAMATEYLDIATRMDILNRRLNTIHELYQILSDELNHIHSSRLEWIVILLITMEVIMGLMHHFKID